MNSRAAWFVSAVLLWGCTTVPILGTDAGSTEPADCVPLALSETVPEAAVEAVQQELQEKYTSGMLSPVCGIDFIEGDSPSLGSPYRWMTVDPSEMAGSSPDPEVFLPVLARWLFPVLWQGTVRCYTMANLSDSGWYVGLFGSPETADYLGPVEQRTEQRSTSCATGFLKYYNPDVALVVFDDSTEGTLFYLFDPAGWSDEFEGMATGEVYVTLDEFVHLWIENFGTEETPDGSI